MRSWRAGTGAAVVTLMAAVLAGHARAQGVTGLEGAWVVVDPTVARHGGGSPTTLTITAAASTITINKNNYGPETYHVDGSTPTALFGGLTGTATIESGTLTITTTRVRRRYANEEPFVNTRQESYRRVGDTLMLEQRVRGQRPGEPAGRWIELPAVAYRKP